MTDMILEFCNSQDICDNCPIKLFFKQCGRGWHIAYEGTEFEKAATKLIIQAYELLERRNQE